MKKYVIFIQIAIISCLCSCGAGSETNKNGSKQLTETKVIIDKISPDKMPGWINKITYDRFEDQLKNLDFNQLNNDSIDDKSAMLFELIKMSMDGEDDLFVKKLQLAYQAETGKNVKALLGQMLVEFLINQGMYHEGVEIFSPGPESFLARLASFPEEEFQPLDSSIGDTLIRGVYRHAMIPVEVNGKPIQMMFDTGADWTLLSSSNAELLGVITDTVQHELSSSTSIKVKARLGYINELKVGNVLINNHHVLVLNDSSVLIETDSINFDIGAVFGWNAIKHLRVVMDDVRKKWQVTLADSSSENLNNFFWFGYPGFKIASEQGQSLAFGFDSGSSESEINKNFLAKFPELKIKKEKTKEGGVGGFEEYEIDVIENIPLFFGSHRLLFRRLGTTGDDDFFFINQDGTIGIDILEDNVITMDYVNKSLIINSGPVKP